MRVNEGVSTEAKGTVRSPDGDPSGNIAGLIVNQGGGLIIIREATAIRMASAGVLWSRIPGDGKPVPVVPVDRNRDGVYDYVRTARQDSAEQLAGPANLERGPERLGERGHGSDSPRRSISVGTTGQATMSGYRMHDGF